jgi:hypothetical protein
VRSSGCTCARPLCGGGSTHAIEDQLDDARRCSTMLDDARRCSTMLDDARRCSTMLDDARRCSTMLDDARRCSTMAAAPLGSSRETDLCRALRSACFHVVAGRSSSLGRNASDGRASAGRNMGRRPRLDTRYCRHAPRTRAGKNRGRFHVCRYCHERIWRTAYCGGHP